MQILHLDLKPAGEDYIELRFFVDNPNQYQSRSLPLAEIADLVNNAEEGYYTYLPKDYAITGQKLYDWLDGSDRFLQRAIDEHWEDGIILAIAAAEQLAHLPWEILYDGNSFLVQREPGIVPVRWVASSAKTLSIEEEPENRALQVLFMATSPLGVEPVLNFEAEEGRILEATKRHRSLALTVEESGCLQELGNLIKYYGKGYFDVLHLTGHASIIDGQPRFVTETIIGEAYYASAREIAKQLKPRLPRLIFLSGCRTGQAWESGSVPSMAEQLLQVGATAVLGWGQKVLDRNAIAAAESLYQELSVGNTLTEALATTYQTLIENDARDWHLLRLYIAKSLPGELVTAPGTLRRKPAPPPSVATQFLDPAGKVKVPTRESFVGRRRQLQNCIRALNPPSEQVGVLIHGMGGLGKSSLAARLCDRLPNFKRVVWVERIDEQSLVRRLSEKLDSQELREALQDPDEELKYRLRRVFQIMAEEGEKPLLLVLDDFEVNLEPREDTYVLKPKPASILEALVWAIRETYAPHRLIITSRYDFSSTQSPYFYKQPLEALRGADLQKKCDRLDAFSEKSKVDKALQSPAIRLADGNPRLLEWLDKILLDKTVDQELILESLAANPIKLREQVLAQTLLEQMDESMGELLSRGLVFELPVPREALATVGESIPELDRQIERAVALGLLEVSPDESLRVPRILPLELPEDTEAFYQQGAEILYKLWWTEAERASEEQILEIHRLGMLAKLEDIAVALGDRIATGWVNSSRYREALELCERTFEVGEDYRLLHTIARAEVVLGLVDEAIAHYQQALNRCPDQDIEIKAAILHNMADIIAQQGDIPQALQLFQQSVEACVQVRAYPDLVTVVGNLCAWDESKSQIYFAQAIWLSLRIQLPVADVIEMLVNLYQKLSPEEPLAALLGAKAMFFCSQLSEDDPQLEQFQKLGIYMLSEAASAQGIETQEAFDTWLVQQQLNKLDFVLPQLDLHLEALVLDEWLFDRAAIVGES